MGFPDDQPDENQQDETAHSPSCGRGRPPSVLRVWNPLQLRPRHSWIRIPIRLRISVRPPPPCRQGCRGRGEDRRRGCGRCEDSPPLLPPSHIRRIPPIQLRIYRLSLLRINNTNITSDVTTSD